MHIKVDDAYKILEQAINSGALPIIPSDKQFWGEYHGRFKDLFGHEWTIAQMLEHLSDDEVRDTAS